METREHLNDILALVSLNSSLNENLGCLNVREYECQPHSLRLFFWLQNLPVGLCSGREVIADHKLLYLREEQTTMIHSFNQIDSLRGYSQYHSG